MKFFLLLFLLFCTPVSARYAPNYDEAVLVGKIDILVTETDTQLRCDAVPFQGVYSTYVFTDGQNYTTDITGDNLIGKPCLAHVVMHPEDIEALESNPNYLGKGNAVTEDKRYIDIVGSNKPIWAQVMPDYMDE